MKKLKSLWLSLLGAAVAPVSIISGTACEATNNSNVKYLKKETKFVRAPFAKHFSILPTTDANSNNYKTLLNVNTIFAHLDSPDVSSRNEFNEPRPSLELVDSDISKSNLYKQGAQEVSEFLAIPDIFKWVTTDPGNPHRQDYNVQSISIFAGDTNIKNENYNLAKKLKPIQKQWKVDYKKHTEIKPIHSVLEKDISLKSLGQKHLTSLGTKGNYVNQYDKMFWVENYYHSDTMQRWYKIHTIKDNTKDFKIDILQAFNDFLNKDEIRNRQGYTEKENDDALIRSLISDHAPTYMDIEFLPGEVAYASDKTVPDIWRNDIPKQITNEDLTLLNENSAKVSLKNNKRKYVKAQNSVRIGHWNILNYGGDNDAKSYTIAKIIEKGGFDIIGLTEINYGKGDKVSEILKHLPEHYKAAIQDPEDAKIDDEYLSSNRFGKAQQEQVVVIYNSKVVKAYEHFGISQNEIPRVQTIKDKPNRVEYSFNENIKYYA
ncbi:hypothetical protein VO56_00055 [Mycoplasmopsis gallinacea]|uniref:Uncharacterized protein n=1 Tax=Mycoplasmopsis gallinacea TaxID=29556 RepID=A0A0D5ZJ24_9BACT|nr:hypothetical protein VO56_00055 [Mycoplasmopsis gallinacea]